MTFSLPQADASPLAPFDGVVLALEHVRERLSIAGAELAVIGEHGLRKIGSVGIPAQMIAEWQELAVQTETGIVMADTGRADIGFFSGLRFTASDERPALLLSLFDTRPRSAKLAQRLVELAQQLTGPAPQTEIEALRARVERQAEVIDHLRWMDVNNREWFDRASSLARVGTWQCDLADNTLIWSNSVYELFDIPPGTALERELTASLYSEQSRLTMERLRAKAIAECGSFTMDAEVITGKGNRRWMRLTCITESRNGVAVRLFGMKQDITEEKLLSDQTRYLAEHDGMTGLANRTLFQHRLADLDGSQHGHAVGGLLLIDLDGFKQINDTYGHALGDECIKEAAIRLRHCCGDGELVARVGGDEFAILLSPRTSGPQATAVADRIVAMMQVPISRDGILLHMSASVGIAHRESASSEELFKQADAALYAAKAAGRNTSRSYVPAMMLV